MHAIEIQHLSKSYGKLLAVDDVSFMIPKGQFFGLLGPNGAGKSTTINCITGVNTFEQGSIAVMGHEVKTDYQAARACIGLSPQEFNADIFAPLEKILNYVGGYFGLDKHTRQARINAVLDQFDLQDHRKKPFGKLSGGLKRRAVLARALVHDPSILILDEPTAGIDVEQRHALWQYLEHLHAAGKTIILTSHYLEEVERLCERAVIIHQGKLIADLAESEFKTNGDKLEDIYLKLTKV